MTTAAILDIDGTLVDTNYHHTIAWQRAFRRSDVPVAAWRVHRAIGMGGEKLVEHVAGERVERQHGDAIRDAEGEIYMQMIGEVRPLPEARELIVDLSRRVDRIVLASSAKLSEVERYLELLDARDLADAWTSAADVENTKPHPELVRAALDAVGANAGFMLGDTPYDCRSAIRGAVPAAAVLTGGFPEADLREAGAVAVFDSVAEIRTRLDQLPLP